MTYLALFGPLAPYAFGVGIASIFSLTAFLFWRERYAPG